MYRTYIPRDDNYLNRLREVVFIKYKLDAISITPAKRGYYGETWRLETLDNRYFVKLDYFLRHQTIFRNSLPVVEYLCNNGIDFINNIIKTCDDELYTAFDSAILGVFEWIDGENMETDETKAPEYQMLCEVHRISKQGFDIPMAEFSDNAAVRFYEKWDQLKIAPKNKATDSVLLILEQYKERLNHCFARLTYVSQICRMETSDLYLTHGDAGGNFLVQNNRFHIVDWDEVMYAPIERDAWVMSCHDWAVKLFNDTLNRSGIPYILRAERLGFYCYHMFFHYLNEFFEDFASHGQTHEIEKYFSESWIWERIQFADTI